MKQVAREIRRARGSAGSTGPYIQKVGAALMAGCEEAMDLDLQDGSQKMWHHGCVQYVQRPGLVIRSHGGEPRGQLLVDSVRRGIRQALFFAWTQAVAING